MNEMPRFFALVLVYTMMVVGIGFMIESQMDQVLGTAVGIALYVAGHHLRIKIGA